MIWSDGAPKALEEYIENKLHLVEKFLQIKVKSRSDSESDKFL